MRTRARRLAGVLAITVVFAVSGCALVPQPVVTRLPTDGTSTSSSTPAPSRSAPSTGPTEVTKPTGPAPSTSATPINPAAPDDGATDCAGGERTLAGSSESFTITGDCPVLRVEGNAVAVDASNASLGSVFISGDRIRLEAAAIGDTTVQGNDSTVEAASAGTLTVRGDRNVVSIPGGAGRVIVSGNDNVVTTPSGDVTVDGQRNQVG